MNWTYGYIHLIELVPAIRRQPHGRPRLNRRTRQLGSPSGGLLLHSSSFFLQCERKGGALAGLAHFASDAQHHAPLLAHPGIEETCSRILVGMGLLNFSSSAVLRAGSLNELSRGTGPRCSPGRPATEDRERLLAKVCRHRRKPLLLRVALFADPPV